MDSIELSKVYNCDCLEYMRNLPDKFFDLAIADPPYGIGASRPSKKPSHIVQKNGTVTSASVTDFGRKDWDNEIPPQEFFDELRRVSKNQIIWGANYFGLQGGMIVWDKINGNSDQYDCEIAYQSFNKRTDLVHYMWNGMFQGKYCGRDIRQAAVQQGNKTLNEKRIHPTQKPVILYEWLLNNYASKGERIFDPMMGSQSSRIAAYGLGFEYYGCELDKEYYNKGNERFSSECSVQINMFNSAKQAIRDRIVMPYARSFTPEQVGILRECCKTFNLPAENLFSLLLEEVSKETEIIGKPDKWISETGKELEKIASGQDIQWMQTGLHK